MSIHPRTNKDGTTSYLVRWRDERGTNRGRTFPTREAAKEFEAARVVQRARVSRSGQYGVVEPAQITLGDWLSRWWDEVVRHETAKSTRVKWASLMNRWITPYVDHVPLPQFGRPAVLEWRSTILDAGATPIVANRAFTCLSSALGRAVERNLLPYNPCLGIKRLRETSIEREPLHPRTVEGLRSILSQRDALAVSLMAYAGLRPGEAFAVRAGAVQDKTLRVTHAFVQGEMKRPKSGRTRVVDLTPSLLADLEAYGVRDMAPGELLFPSSRGSGTPICPNNWRNRVWKAATEEIGIGGTHVYALRHTFASLLIHSGASLPVVSHQLGHANPTITGQVYVHLFRDVEMGATVRPVEDVIGEARMERKVA